MGIGPNKMSTTKKLFEKKIRERFADNGTAPHHAHVSSKLTLYKPWPDNDN
jgi:hypothetical protein